MKEGWITTPISAISLLLIIISYLFWDIPITKYCKTVSPALLKIAETVTIFGIATWYLVGSLIFYLFFLFIYKNTRYADRSLFVFLSLSIIGIFITLLKWVAGRHRPIDLFNSGHFGFDFFGRAYELISFPSGHAQTAFTLATALTLFYPRCGIPLFMMAAAVGVSRIILTSHYLSDVIAGAAIGIIGTRIIKYYFDRYQFNAAQKKNQRMASETNAP
ncbi:MAG: phosphatase PAP2 family protein [Deltaproteobacteria bacterium]|nr:phosphatase PAP2 family protein [Deltaproteobacteria bacterium]